MPITIPPALHQALLDRLAVVQAESARFGQGATATQARIDGTDTGPPPGLQLEEDVNANLYGQYDARVALFEAERRAIDGVYPSPPIVPSDIDPDGVNHVGVFWTGNLTLAPNNPPGLTGLGGSDPVNETAELANEVAQITLLLALSYAMRTASAAYTAWVASLNSQVTLLTTQINAASANESYGPAHPAVVAATAERSAIQALLPAPDPTNSVLNTRQAQAVARQAALAPRVAALVSDAVPFRTERYNLLNSRINPLTGTLVKLRGAQRTIGVLNDTVALNSSLNTLYNGAL